MKYSISFFLVALMVLVSCGRSGDHQNHQPEPIDDNDPNEALYNQVNEEHDIYMLKMDDLFRLKGQLMEKMAKDESMSADKKKAILEIVAELDSADKGMRSFMHEWMNGPDADSIDVEKRREYFESEMEKIKKVGEQMTEAIDKAKEEVGK